METYLDKIDEIIFRLEEIRENCNMDQLLAENADEMNDDDSDWDVWAHETAQIPYNR